MRPFLSYKRLIIEELRPAPPLDSWVAEKSCRRDRAPAATNLIGLGVIANDLERGFGLPARSHDKRPAPERRLESVEWKGASLFWRSGRHHCPLSVLENLPDQRIEPTTAGGLVSQGAAIEGKFIALWWKLLGTLRTLSGLKIPPRNCYNLL